MERGMAACDLVHLRILTADAVSLLCSLAQNGIQTMDTALSEDLELTLVISGRDLRAVRRLCEKRGAELEIMRRTGVFRQVYRLLQRPVLVIGAVIAMIFLLFLPSRVLFVEVEGNVTVPKRHILAAAEEIGVGFGTSRRKIHNESFKNAIIQQVPQLQWACVNTRGCVAVITVRERPVSLQEKQADGLTRIVASCDGVILSADATAGNLLCHPGQAVIKGQTLISGYTDCTLTIRATGAAGEVYAQTKHEILLLTPLSGAVRGNENGTKTQIGLLIGKKRINLWKDSGNFDSTCGRMYEEYYITLPGGYRLPAAITVDRITFYETSEVSCAVTGNSAEFAREYLLSRLISGRILQQQIREEDLGDAVKLYGVFWCTEMIGREAAEEIGELHG